MKKEKKKLTNGPNDARCVIWARSRRHRPLKPSLSHQNLDRSKEIELVRKNKRKSLLMAQTTQDVIWARSRRHRPLKPSLSHQNLDRSKEIELVRKNKRKSLLMAQTTQDASFGPVLVDTAHSSPPRLIKT